ncbi:hypothetical protein [Actinoplanes sp. NPDC051859]|uniref:hypothetical protein n=1 Tax=Actinoplanes sp. NPDC051859 TaxID=3363909 RepID=UPI00379FF404
MSNDSQDHDQVPNQHADAASGRAGEHAQPEDHSQAGDHAQPEDHSQAGDHAQPEDHSQAGDHAQPEDHSRDDDRGSDGDPGGVDRGRALRFAPAGAEDGPRSRRRRRWFIGGVAAGAALIVGSLCVGGLAVVNAVADFRGDRDKAQEQLAARDTACLELEQRLNRLTPPGATATPDARAVAVRDENTAARVYVGQLRGEHTEDLWRQLLDARTSYAEALAAQTESRTPAFFVVPRTGDGAVAADELVRRSPAVCSGLIRRLAAPEL